MIINELLLDVFGHPRERIVDSLMFPRHLLNVVFVTSLSIWLYLTWRVVETRLSRSEYCCSVMFGLKGNPCTDLPHLMRVETTYWPWWGNVSILKFYLCINCSLQDRDLQTLPGLRSHMPGGRQCFWSLRDTPLNWLSELFRTTRIK